jgi:hypothetical protein
MPLFMDIHQHIPGLTKEAVADAHEKDLQVQGKYGVKYLNYWYDEKMVRCFVLLMLRIRKPLLLYTAKLMAY